MVDLHSDSTRHRWHWFRWLLWPCLEQKVFPVQSSLFFVDHWNFVEITVDYIDWGFPNPGMNLINHQHDDGDHHHHHHHHHLPPSLQASITHTHHLRKLFPSERTSKNSSKLSAAKSRGATTLASARIFMDPPAIWDGFPCYGFTPKHYRKKQQLGGGLTMLTSGSDSLHQRSRSGEVFTYV